MMWRYSKKEFNLTCLSVPIFTSIMKAFQWLLLHKMFLKIEDERKMQYQQLVPRISFQCTVMSTPVPSNQIEDRRKRIGIQRKRKKKIVAIKIFFSNRIPVFNKIIRFSSFPNIFSHYRGYHPIISWINREQRQDSWHIVGHLIIVVTFFNTDARLSIERFV